MEKYTEMTEVAPAKPDVKPKPQRDVPKTRPNKDDPWTVPAPKVNPTPKAIKEKVMTDKKMLITSKKDFDAIKKIVTKDTFYKKFEVSMKVVAQVVAEDAITNLYFEDSRVATADEIKSLKESGLI